MVLVAVRKEGIRMHGHAECSVNGQDIVCSAISALTCNLINSLSNLTSTKIRAETDAGMTKISWEEPDEMGKLFIDSWFLGLVAVNQNYNCIEFV